MQRPANLFFTLKEKEKANMIVEDIRDTHTEGQTIAGF